MSCRPLLLVLLTLLAGGLAGYSLAIGQPFATGRVLAQEDGVRVPSEPPAAVGSGFTYQGSLSESGVPYDGACDFQFLLYDEAAFGNQVGVVQSLNNVPVSGGVFTVALNGGGEFGPDAFNGQARWLEVRVRCPAGGTGWTILGPRQPLAATPYALGLRAGTVISGSQAGAMVAVQNGSGGGFGVYDAGQSGLFINRASLDAIHIDEAGLEGVDVNLAGADGFEVDSAVEDGLHVSTVGGDGVHIQHADGDGLFVCSTGSETSCTPSGYNNGLEVGSAGHDGVFVYRAGEPNNAVYAVSKNGFEVAGAEGFGVFVGYAGADGVYVGSAEGDGFYLCRTGSSTTCNPQATRNGIEALNPQDWAGYFGKSIRVIGSCSGCLLSTFGVNVGSGTLQPGDMVILRQLADGESLGLSVLMEVDAAEAGQPIVGVVDGWAELVMPDDPKSEERAGLVPRGGPVAPGEYVNIIIYGPVRVRAGAAGDQSEMGQKLTVDRDGLARPLEQREFVLADGGTETMMEQAPTVGVALGEVDEEGMVWVLVNPH